MITIRPSLQQSAQRERRRVVHCPTFSKDAHLLSFQEANHNDCLRHRAMQARHGPGVP